jgi:OmpA-OmpF porin, OOP family
MSTFVKILLGALATVIGTWFLNGPMGLGSKCAATAPVAATVPVADVVKNCQAEVDAVVKGKTINFTSGGAKIAPDSLPLIDAVAKAAKDCAGTNIEVSGHTDAQGNDAYNQRLSEERANAVVAALAERGIPTDRMTPKGYGETKPLDPGSSPEALAKNRRIEFGVSAAAAAPAAADKPAG